MKGHSYVTTGERKRGNEMQGHSNVTTAHV